MCLSRCLTALEVITHANKAGYQLNQMLNLWLFVTKTFSHFILNASFNPSVTFMERVISSVVLWYFFNNPCVITFHTFKYSLHVWCKAICPLSSSDKTFPSADTLCWMLGGEQRLSFTDLPITHSEHVPAIITFKSRLMPLTGILSATEERRAKKNRNNMRF